MWVNLLQEQIESVQAAVLNAVDSADHIEATQKVSDFLMRAGPPGGPQNRAGRTRWHLGSSAVHDDTGSAVGYTTCLAWTTAGVVTSAAVYVSTTGSVHSTTLGERSVPRHEVTGSDTPQDASVLSVGWSVPAEDRLDAFEKALSESGYHTVPVGSQTLALLDVAEGRAACFVGRVADPATRLATSLLISEAHGQVSDWSGGYPGLDDDSVIAGSHFTHYQRLTRLLGATHRAAESAIDPQEVSHSA
ncbi:hypothetical protein ABT369_35775 [Dactylosporangium sp. NPDC000244]|uniref:hypothetical protein n=1 Tax=Dactylosporangium sp. NPDC000244 TaxID=3154365 RepID=UPI00332498B5